MSCHGARRLLTPFLAAAFLIVPRVAFAVDFFDGSRAPKAFYFLTYTSLYAADETTNADGSVSRRDYGYTKLDELLRLSYYTPNFTFCAFVPFGRAEASSRGQVSGGLGDVSLGGGGFLPIRSVDILPMIFVKFPTGSYSSEKTINYGTNQADIKPAVFLYKAFGRFSVDAAAKYFFRLENPATHAYPGDELYLQTLLGWQATEKLKLGPSVNWMRSQNQKLNGQIAANSARESFSVGPEFYYLFPKLSVTLTWLYDAASKNLTRGHFVQIKTCSKFG